MQSPRSRRVWFGICWPQESQHVAFYWHKGLQAWYYGLFWIAMISLEQYCFRHCFGDAMKVSQRNCEAQISMDVLITRMAARSTRTDNFIGGGYLIIFQIFIKEQQRRLKYYMTQKYISLIFEKTILIFKINHLLSSFFIFYLVKLTSIYVYL